MTGASVHVTELRRLETNVGFKYYWCVEVVGGEEYVVDYYMTNNEGCGVFTQEQVNQLLGTCDFCLRQKTLSGAYKAIRKLMEKWYM